MPAAPGFMKICRAVRDDLNARFPGRFTAIAKVNPKFDAKRMEDLQVVATPAAMESEIGAADTDWSFDVDVGLCKKPADEDEWEDLVELNQEISEAMLGTDLLQTDEVTVQLICEKVAFTNSRPFIEEQAAFNDLFISVIRLTYTYEP